MRKFKFVQTLREDVGQPFVQQELDVGVGAFKEVQYKGNELRSQGKICDVVVIGD